MNEEKSKRPARSIWNSLILIVVAPLLLASLPVILVAYLLLTVLLHVLAWLVWNSRGIELLYVYSNSPHWQEYIEQNILPRLPSGAIVLNWSERRKWRFNLPTVAFRHFGGYREFNPMALVFRPFRWVKIFRFFKPFRDFKHGKPDALHKMESEFFAVLNE
ncbi:MAG: hypothetical protein ABIK89_17410 [Planctomycetota bacterium]